ncbi:alcohol dehydrogenase 1-like [Bombyx mandarina]|nr:alcohol dehydrogenase 1-like [Bombyx mandarina]
MKFSEHTRLDKCGHGGTIINVASVTGHWVAPFFPAYIASKYGVVGFSKSFGHAYNYKSTGVRVVALCPSFTLTPLVFTKIVSDEQEDAFDRYRSNQVWQSADEVGIRAVEVFKNADSGTSWDVVGGSPAFESLSTEYITIPDEIIPEGTCQVDCECD